MSKKILYYVGVGIGVIFFIVGLLMCVGILKLTGSPYEDMYTTSFGADFYTYTYNSTIHIQDTLSNIYRCMGVLLILVGAITALKYYIKIVEEQEKDEVVAILKAISYNIKKKNEDSSTVTFTDIPALRKEAISPNMNNELPPL